MWFSELKYEINIGPALLQLIYLKVGIIVQLFAFLHFLMIQVISSILNHTYFFSMANWYVRFSTQLILRGLFSIKRFSSTAFLQGNQKNIKIAQNCIFDATPQGKNTQIHVFHNAVLGHKYVISRIYKYVKFEKNA